MQRARKETTPKRINSKGLWGGTEFLEEEQKAEVATCSEQAEKQCEARLNGDVAAMLKHSNFIPRAV